MKTNITNFMFLLIMVNSIIMAISSNNLLFSWMSMEINLISFIPLISQSKKMSDQLMKYLIIQSSASSILLLSILMNSFLETEMKNSILLLMSMMMKMGMMPTHLWLPTLMMSMSWNNCMILSTIQKIIPIMLTSQMISIKLITMPVVLTLLLSPMVGMKQLSTKKIMAYSSISNLPWMLMSMYNSIQQFLMFMLIYTTMTIMIMSMLSKKNINFASQLKPMNKMTKLNFMIMMLSLSGMPPMAGFFIKWMILDSTIQNQLYLVSITMILSSTILSYMYMKLSFSSMLMFSTSKKKKMIKPNMNTMIINLVMISIIMMI